jgi:hypothetical protein
MPDGQAMASWRISPNGNGSLLLVAQSAYNGRFTHRFAQQCMPRLSTCCFSCKRAGQVLVIHLQRSLPRVDLLKRLTHSG